MTFAIIDNLDNLEADHGPKEIAEDGTVFHGVEYFLSGFREEMPSTGLDRF